MQKALAEAQPPRQTKKQAESPRWTPFQKKVHALMAGLLQRIPAKLLDDLEYKNLFAGHYRSDLEASLPELKKALPDLGMLNQIEEVEFHSAGNLKHYGWYIPAQKGKPTILHSMGNIGSLRSILRYQALIDDGYGFMSYEYPGYGRTQGKPTEEGINAAGEAASNFLATVKKVPHKQQVVHGVSLGGTVTATLAQRLPVQGVILESTMTSFPDVARLKVKNYAPEWVVPLHEITRSQMASEQKLKTMNKPLLVLHGSKDALMPTSFAERLYHSAATPPDQKKLVVFPHQGHKLDTGWTLPYMRKFLAGFSETPERKPLSKVDALKMLETIQYLQRVFGALPASKNAGQNHSESFSLNNHVAPTKLTKANTHITSR